MPQDIVTLGLNPDGSTHASSHKNVPSEVIQHLQILLRGMALHAVEGDPRELQQFQQKMSGIADSLRDDSSAEDVLVGIGQALRSLEDYNKRAAIVFSGQASELRNMLATMTTTVMFITASSETSVKQLTLIETRLRQATSIQDTRSLKSSLDECLSLVRTESLRLQNESRSKINALKTDVDRLTSRLRTVTTEDSNDPVTGLPGRVIAEESIEKKIAAAKEFTLALFLIDRVASINGRFGRLVGDDVLVTGAQSLAQKLQGSTLFRWSGPAFVAVFDPSVSPSQAELRAKQAAAMRIEKNIEADNRSVLILITCTLNIQRAGPKTTAESLFRTIDSFMAANGIGSQG